MPDITHDMFTSSFFLSGGRSVRVFLLYIVGMTKHRVYIRFQEYLSHMILWENAQLSSLKVSYLKVMHRANYPLSIFTFQLSLHYSDP
ncbi:hypothetical protein FKM82_028430 [Ascaphus truei]